MSLSRRSRTLERQLAAYTIAGGSLLVAAESAHAQVIYSGLKNLAVGTNSSVPIDYDGDGRIDVTFANLLNSASTPPAQELRATTPGGMDAILGTKPNDIHFADALAAGHVITGTAEAGGSDYWADISVLQDGNNAGKWTPNAEAYMGFRFLISGDQHNGWVRVQVNSDLTAVVRDWAYNATGGTGGGPGASIAAGDIGVVPEPSSLALLAVGSAAVGAWARRTRRSEPEA